MRLRTALCALSVLALNACGGGGGGDAPNTPAAGTPAATTQPPVNNPPPTTAQPPVSTTPPTPSQPANPTGTLPPESFLRVDGGNSAVETAAYQADFSARESSSTFTLEGSTWQELAPDFGSFGVSFWYRMDDPSHFVLLMNDNLRAQAASAYYACRSNNWTSAGIDTLTQTISQVTGVTVPDVPVCQQSGLTIDTTQRHIQFLKVALPSFSATGKSVTLSANFGLKPLVVTQPPVTGPTNPGTASGQLVIEAGSSKAAPAVFKIDSSQFGSATLGQVNADYVELSAGTSSLTLYTQQGHDNKYVLLLSAKVGEAEWESYACFSGPWTAADKQTMAADFPALDVCHGSMDFDPATRRLTMVKTPVLEQYGSGRQLTVSFDAILPRPN